MGIKFVDNENRPLTAKRLAELRQEKEPVRTDAVGEAVLLYAQTWSKRQAEELWFWMHPEDIGPSKGSRGTKRQDEEED
jgi:hypothetical protein